jgi:phosphopantetheine adenylyltransferase
MPTLQHAFVSSSAVRSLISFKGKTEHLIPEQISKIIEDKKCI